MAESCKSGSKTMAKSSLFSSSAAGNGNAGTTPSQTSNTKSSFLKIASGRSSSKSAKQAKSEVASAAADSNAGASGGGGGEQSGSSNYKQFLKKAITNLNPIKRSSQSSSSTTSASGNSSNNNNKSSSSGTTSSTTLKALKSTLTSTAKTTTTASPPTPPTQSSEPVTENKLILSNADPHTKCTFEQLRTFNKQNANAAKEENAAAGASNSTNQNKTTTSSSSGPTTTATAASTSASKTSSPIPPPASSKSSSSSRKKSNAESVDMAASGEAASGCSSSGTKSARSSFKNKGAKLYKDLEKKFSFKNKSSSSSDASKKPPQQQHTRHVYSPGGGRTKTKNELAAGYGFNEDQIGVFEETFQIFDKDCDGFITLVEIRTVMNALGFFPCDEIIRKSIQNIDSDNSGTVDFEEFICMMSKFRKIKTSSELDDELLEIFQIFDRNQDGFIDKEELKDVLLRLGENITDDEVAEMIKEADTDGDNKVSFAEFRSILHDNRTLAKT